MRTIVISILFLLFPTFSFAEEFEEELYLIFESAGTPAGFYESFKELRVEKIVESTGRTVDACVIDLDLHVWSAEDDIPIDDFGNPFILGQAMKFISAEELYHSIDPHTCDFYQNLNEAGV